MTQPVSSGARWPHGNLSCTDPSGEDAESSTCDETSVVSCSAERAHRVTRVEPHGDGSGTSSRSGPVGDDAKGGASRRGSHDGDLPRGLDFCRRADTVVEGFLCNEPVVVSDACRKPSNAFDELVCDDPKMQRIQWAILRETWSLIKAMALALTRGRP